MIFVPSFKHFMLLIVAVITTISMPIMRAIRNLPKPRCEKVSPLSKLSLKNLAWQKMKISFRVIYHQKVTDLVK